MPEKAEKGKPESAQEVRARVKDEEERKVLEEIRVRHPDKARLLSEDNKKTRALALALDAMFKDSNPSYGECAVIYRGQIKLEVDNKQFKVKKV